MIVWLNGPFGVGKSSVTAALRRRVPAARTFDPERIGWVLKRTVGVWRRGDYQHLRTWRRATVVAAARRARGTDLLIIPMTVLRRGYLEELLAGLRARGHEVRHVLLDVSPDVLLERIENDPVHDPRAWRLDNLEIYLTARYALEGFGEVVDTDERTIEEVADAVQEALSG